MNEITCCDVSSYENALTKGKKYEMLSHDADKRQVKVRGDNKRTRWFPAICFDLKGRNIAVLQSFTLDDPIGDPRNDCIEVTIKLSNRRRRWCFFTTPAWLAAYLEHGPEAKITDHDGFEIGQLTYLGDLIAAPSGLRFQAVFVPHLIIVPEITEETVGATLRHMDSHNELGRCTRALG